MTKTELLATTSAQQVDTWRPRGFAVPEKIARPPEL